MEKFYNREKEIAYLQVSIINIRVMKHSNYSFHPTVRKLTTDSIHN
jgi:hypothetical protein